MTTAADDADPTAMSGPADTNDGDTGQADASDDMGATTTGEEACGSANVCAPAIPEGWSGPVALRTLEDDDLPVCGGDYYPTLGAELFGDLYGDDPATCECSCDVASASCTGSGRVRISNTAPSSEYSPCTYGIDTLLNETVASGSPLSYPYGAVPWGTNHTERGVTVDTISVALAGSCTPDFTVDKQSAGFNERFAMCLGSEAEGACAGDDVCVPSPVSPFDGAVCVWTDGDVECVPEYPDRRVLYEGSDDTRGCTDCTCGSLQGDCGPQQVDLSWWSSSSAYTSPYGIDVPSYCDVTSLCTVPACAYYPDISLHSVTFDPGSFVADDAAEPCHPSGGVPQGEVALEGTTTVCCTTLR